MAYTTPKTWAADELLTASDLNQYVRDNMAAVYALVQGGRKNLLDNGAMQVHQRGTSASGLTSVASYATADRWLQSSSSLGTWTMSVENDAPTGSGFRKSLKMLCTTNDASPSAGDYASVIQRVEGQNVQSIKKGTSSAAQVTLTFWSKSNATGTYIVELGDSDNTRHCSKSYTVSASATWEQQSITFPADVAGEFTNDNGESLVVEFHLGAGSNRTSGTLATTWASTTQANRAVGQTNLGAATNNYWQVTGCQLEIGSASTGFEHKDYGTELAECQRYYEVGGTIQGTGYQASGYHCDVSVSFMVQKRATPTVTQTNLYTDNCTATPAQNSASVHGFNSYRNITTGPGQMQYSETWTASADL